mmetsp:Transcript_3369/g.4883  ORF Transcript_3369/g.4883 Transcript_3369/m.4883 type:complete len:105 (-) Transcript_3369:767-1081(-)
MLRWISYILSICAKVNRDVSNVQIGFVFPYILADPLLECMEELPTDALRTSSGDVNFGNNSKNAWLPLHRPYHGGFLPLKAYADPSTPLVHHHNRRRTCHRSIC